MDILKCGHGFLTLLPQSGGGLCLRSLNPGGLGSNDLTCDLQQVGGLTPRDS